MGFDNECILNIQSLAGEYFCPVCRLLVYPNEALQSQCTHLYCKPCLTYVVSTTHACPYDGYLVTEADSKPLVESNKALAETIDKIAVHCLYHRSGCTWQGSLSECTSHCAACAFGNSPVVCNRCGTQIVHRQVQEHAQSCPGVQPQAQQAEGAQDATAASGAAAAVDPNQAAIQTGTVPSQAQLTQVATGAATAPVSGSDQTQASASTQPQAAAVATPTPEQWYQQQQQYQQYYQQYPGYDPYQQQYQTYNPYQQQAHQQYPQQHVQPQPAQVVQGQHQPQVYMQPQPTQQTPARPPLVPQSQPQVNPQAPVGSQPQMHVPVNPQQPPPQMQLQSYPPIQNNQNPQMYPQTQSQPPQYQGNLHGQTPMQQRPQMPHQIQHPQPHHLPGPPQPHPHPQAQPHPHMHPQPQLQQQTQVPLQPQSQPQSQTRPQPHPHLPGQQPAAPTVTGHQSYPQSQTQHQMISAPQQYPLQMHPQQGAAQQAPQMRPPQTHVQMPHQQVPSMPQPLQGQLPNVTSAQQLSMHPQAHQSMQPHYGSNLPQQQQVHGHLSQAQPFPGQTAGLVQNHSQQPVGFMQQQQGMQTQLRSHGPPGSMANAQLQQNASMPYGMQPHHVGRPVMSNHGHPHQPFQQPSVPNSNLVQPSGIQPSTTNQNYPSNALQSGGNSHLSAVQVKPEQQDGGVPQMTDGNIAVSSQATDAVDRVTKSESDSRSVDEEKSTNENGGRNMEHNVAGNDMSEEPGAKQMVKDDLANKAKPSAAEQEGDPHSSALHNDNSLVEDKGTGNGQLKRSPKLRNTDVLEGTDLKSKNDALDSQMTGTGSASGDKDSRSVIQASEMNSLPPPPFSRDPSQQPFGQNLVPANDRMLPQPPYHERNFPPMHNRPPQSQMQMLGQPLSQVRPQLHNALGAPDLFHPPIAKQSHASYPGGPTGGFPGPGSSTSFGRGPGFLGPQRSFDPQSAASQGHHNQGHLPPHLGNHIDTEYGNKRPGYIDGRQPDSLLPGSSERFGVPGPNSFRTSGAAGKDLVGGVHDPSYPYGLHEDRFKSFPEDRFKRLAEEGFNRMPEEQFKSFSMESNRRNRREFEEDLKQFPVPGHLDGEGVPKFDNYFSSSRPLDRGPHDGFNHDIGPKMDGGPSTAASKRLLPPYHPGGSSLHSMRPIGFQEDNMGRQRDGTGLRSDFLRRAPDSGQRLPFTRSPGREYLRFGPGNQSRLEEMDGRESRLFGERSVPFNLPPDGSGFLDSRFPVLPSHLRRGEPDSHLPLHLRNGDLVGPDILPSHLRGIEPGGPRNFPSHMRMGEPAGFGSFNHSRIGEPRNNPLNPHIGEAIGGNLASHARVGEPGFSSTFPYHGNPTDGGFFNAGDVEPLDQSRKRKHRSMGWCRICKLDCETVEGLELHSQTREHQKIAMDMVLSIKKENTKKQKVSSNNHVSQEDANKSRNESGH